jgi:EmrB/QacA subfamily drug resistance transporter
MSPLRRSLVVVALLVGTFLASLDVMVLGTAMPTIIADLGGLPLYGWVFAAYLLTSTTTVPIYGKLADRWGRKPTFLLGAGIFLAGSVACGLSTSMPALIGSRAIQGLGAGAIIPVTMTLFGDLFHAEQRVKLQGAFSVVWGVSSVAGPVVGGAIVERWPWPWVFYINLPIGLLACGVLALALHESIPRRAEPVDWLGALLLTATISSLLTGFTLLDQRNLPLALPALAASPVLGALFLVAERRARDPIVPLGLFRDRVIAVSTATGVFLGGVLFPTVAFLPLLMRGAFGDSPTLAGASITPLSVTWTVTTFAASPLILRAGYRTAIWSGSAALLVGTTLAAASAWTGFRSLAYAGTTALGAGMGLIMTAQNVVIQDRVGWAQRGSATALLLFSRSVGGTIFVSSFGLIMAAHLAASLQGLPVAPDPNTLLDPDRWSDLDPAVLVHARDALRRAVGVVLGLVMACSWAVMLGNVVFPDVRPERKREPS